MPVDGQVQPQAWRWAGWATGLAGLALLTLLVGHPLSQDSGIAPLAGALAGDPWLIGLRWGLLLVWLALVLGTGWWLTRPAGRAMRWLTRLVLLSLLIGILAPPDLLKPVMIWLAALVPFRPSTAAGPDVAAFGHFGFFAVLSALLIMARADLGWLRLAALLGLLAIVTELMQLFVAGRTADPWDVLVDLTGIWVGALLAVVAMRFRIRVGGGRGRDRVQAVPGPVRRP